MRGARQPACQPVKSSGVNSPLTCLLPSVEQVLEGRTAHAIRNRFYRLQQQQRQQEEHELLVECGLQTRS